MQAAATLSARRAVPGSAVIALAIGLGLYQLTSLVLGPATSREIHVSLLLPRVDVQQMDEQELSNLDAVIASRLEPGVAAIISPLASAGRITSSRPSQSLSRATTSATPAQLAPIALPVEVPLPATIRGDSEKSHYHDAGERGLRLARGR